MKKFIKSVCSIILIALLFICNLYAQEEFKFQQTDDEDGLVVMEAENYSEIIIQDGLTDWDTTTTPVNFSGTSGMQAVPPDGSPYAAGDTAKKYSPILSYSVNFVKEGNTYIWARTSHLSGGDDSFHAGFDYIVPTTASFIAYGTDSVNIWYWISYLSGDTDNRAYFYAVPGVHDFKVYIRECGFKIDKIILTTNVDYLPTGLGPDETLPDVDTSDNDTIDEKPDAIFIEPFNSQESDLIKNYPNPFSNEINIEYFLTEESQISIQLFDIDGRLITTIFNGIESGGYQRKQLSATELTSGLYFIRFENGNDVIVKKCMLLKE